MQVGHGTSLAPESLGDARDLLVLQAKALGNLMKRFLFIVALFLCLSGAATERGLYKTLVCIEWDYAPEDVDGTTFRIYGSPDPTQPIELWPLVATVTSQTWAQFEADPVAMFFAVTAENWRGESPFSNVLRIQGPPRSDFAVRITG